MEIDDIVLINCYRGYRPGWIKEIGKRKVLIIWADGNQEWIENNRIKEPENLKDRSWMERSYKIEKQLEE